MISIFSERNGAFNCDIPAGNLAQWLECWSLACRLSHRFDRWPRCVRKLCTIGQPIKLSLPSLWGQYLSSHPCNFMDYGDRGHYMLYIILLNRLEPSIAQIPLGSSCLDSTFSTCQAHAFWLCRACQTAWLDTLDTTNSTGSTRSTRRERQARLAT